MLTQHAIVLRCCFFSPSLEYRLCYIVSVEVAGGTEQVQLHLRSFCALTIIQHYSQSCQHPHPFSTLFYRSPSIHTFILRIPSYFSLISHSISYLLLSTVTSISLFLLKTLGCMPTLLSLFVDLFNPIPCHLLLVVLIFHLWRQSTKELGNHALFFFFLIISFSFPLPS